MSDIAAAVVPDTLGPRALTTRYAGGEQRAGECPLSEAANTWAACADAVARIVPEVAG